MTILASPMGQTLWYKAMNEIHLVFIHIRRKEKLLSTYVGERNFLIHAFFLIFGLAKKAPGWEGHIF